jgi:DNA-directed RNA polymerase subunit E'/Rpb7
MKSVMLEKRICLHSKYLDQNLENHILNKLRELTTGNCTQEYGYVLKIDSLFDILDHQIGRADSDNIFNVKFKADILKPEKGLEMIGKVCMIYKDGIFINVLEKQKMLIPANKMDDYVFSESGSVYIHKTTSKTIKMGDMIKAVVTVVGYNNQSYSCFGCIV